MSKKHINSVDFNQHPNAMNYYENEYYEENTFFKALGRLLSLPKGLRIFITVSIVSISLGVFFVNKSALILLAIFLPFFIYDINPNVRDFLLLVTYYFYFDYWALIFLSLTYWGGVVYKYFEFGLFSLTFSSIALVNIFWGENIGDTLLYFDFNTISENRWEVLSLSIIVYLFVFGLGTIVYNLASKQEQKQFEHYPKETNQHLAGGKTEESEDDDKDDSKKERVIDPSSGMFSFSERFENWVRKDRADL